MKKLFLGLLLAAFTLSIYSCRETTEKNSETTIEEVEAETENTIDEVETEANDVMQEAEQATDSL